MTQEPPEDLGRTGGIRSHLVSSNSVVIRSHFGSSSRASTRADAALCNGEEGDTGQPLGGRGPAGVCGTTQSDLESVIQAHLNLAPLIEYAETLPAPVAGVSLGSDPPDPISLAEDGAVKV